MVKGKVTNDLGECQNMIKVGVYIFQMETIFWEVFSPNKDVFEESNDTNPFATGLKWKHKLHITKRNIVKKFMISSHGYHTILK